MCLKNFPEYFADKVKLAYVHGHNYFAAVAITSLKQLFRLCLCPEAVSKFRYLYKSIILALLKAVIIF